MALLIAISWLYSTTANVVRDLKLNNDFIRKIGKRYIV